jgi:glucose-6-phosphate 1-epimerase
MKPHDSVTQRIERDHARLAIKGVLTFEAGRGSLPTVLIRNEHASATIYLHGAHVAHFQPKGKGPVLWMSDWSWFEAGKPIRGGVPICWPWFGPNAVDPKLPGHGFARLVEWKLAKTTQLPDGRTQVQLALTPANVKASPSVELLKAFPHPFQLLFTVTVGAALEMELSVRNTGSAAFSFEEALHTYFAVGDVREVRVRGLGGVKYLDRMQGLKECTQEAEEVVFEGETDRVYTGTQGTCEIVDPKLERCISVAKEHSDATVVWNPHKVKAKAMPDFGDKEWPGMVCIETVNVGASAVTLKPGEMHAMKAFLALV